MNAALYSFRFWISVFTFGLLVRQERVEESTYKLLGYQSPSVAGERPRQRRHGAHGPAAGGAVRW